MSSARGISWFYFKAGLIAVLIPVIFIGLLLFVLTLHCKPLPPQPMFHHLNTEEIRDFCGPNWHSNISLTDRTGRHVYFDEDLNLVVIVCLSIAERDEFDQWPGCNFESAKFSKGSKHDFTVSRCRDSILVYQEGRLLSETPLPPGGTARFVDACIREGADFQDMLHAQGLEVMLPALTSDE